MDPIRFDSISRFFAQRRLSRRDALTRTGTGLAAAGLAATGLGTAGLAAPSAAQGSATPVSSDSTSDNTPTMLYVQSFQSGSIAPKQGEDGRYTVTLDHGLGQTIYFSDRPDRIVGAAPTDQFLNWLGFPADNPPNAAILTDNGNGENTLAVVELFDPTYDPDTATATYELAVLDHWEESSDLGFAETPVDVGAIGETFGTSHLFIDGVLDCPDATMSCLHNGEVVGTIPNEDHDGYCGQWTGSCFPCENPEPSYWVDQCNERFDACEGDCGLWNFCSRDALLGDTWCQDSDSHSTIGD
ncbi:MAG TPA: hypothetical protein VD789_02255 [Thermomicrobiales bacterium]|nr:hypothetical protein [Thermomicrobiales bacterium]